LTYINLQIIWTCHFLSVNEAAVLEVPIRVTDYAEDTGSDVEATATACSHFVCMGIVGEMIHQRITGERIK
jgi:hypothetical protein